MKLWVLVAGDFTPLGGMDQANYALARYLARRPDTTAHLVTHRAWDDLATLPNVAVHTVRRPLGSHLLGMPLLRQAGYRWGRRLAPQGARLLVNGGNCGWEDVNWVHYVHAAYPQHVATSIRYRLQAHLAHTYALATERLALTRARLLFCNSQRTRQDVVERFGVPESRVQVVYYGTDPARCVPIDATTRLHVRTALHWHHTRPLVAFVGALGDRRKGFDTLFASWQRLCIDPHWDCDLVVMGTGVELPLWQQRARDTGCASRITFLGFRRDVPTLLAACDVLVHPARYEPYGLGVHEALCCGLPALVSASAGVAERYPPALHTLLLPEPGNVEALIDRLWHWRMHAEAYRVAVATVTQTLRAYTWDHMAAQMVSCIERAS